MNKNPCEDDKTYYFCRPFLNRLGVKGLKEYRIPYLGLKLGQHQYQFTLTAAFFDKFEFSEIHDCNIVADVVLEKQSTMLIIDTVLSGEVSSICDHCGDDLRIEVETSQRLIVKFGDETGSTDEDILVLGPGDHEVDMSQFLYEYAHLALPARHVHKSEADCNQEALRRLASYRVEQTANTQWANLKNLNYEDPEDKEFFDEEE